MVVTPRQILIGTVALAAVGTAAFISKSVSPVSKDKAVNKTKVKDNSYNDNDQFSSNATSSIEGNGNNVYYNQYAPPLQAPQPKGVVGTILDGGRNVFRSVFRR